MTYANAIAKRHRSIFQSFALSGGSWRGRVLSLDKFPKRHGCRFDAHALSLRIPEQIRCAYGGICCHRFKPKNITDDIFLAQILGHKLLGPNASLSVGQSYKDFYIKLLDKGQAHAGTPGESKLSCWLIFGLSIGSLCQSSPGPCSSVRKFLGIFFDRSRIPATIFDVRRQSPRSAEEQPCHISSLPTIAMSYATLFLIYLLRDRHSVRECTACQISNRPNLNWHPAKARSTRLHLSLIVKPAEAEILYFHEFLDAVAGTFTTETRLFDTAKRCNLVRDEAGVHAPTIPLSSPSAALQMRPISRL